MTSEIDPARHIAAHDNHSLNTPRQSVLYSGQHASLHHASPSSTLQNILTTSDPVNYLSKDDILLWQSFQSASSGDKTFAKDVLNASLALRDWSEELDTWKWNGSFEDVGIKVQKSPEALAAVQHFDSEGNDQPVSSASSESARDIISTAGKIFVLSDRLDSIAAEFAQLDIVNMKNHVLQTYLSDNALLRQDLEETKFVAPKAYGNLDNFMSLVTVVLLQALPYHYKISTSIDTWIARFSVLKLIPSFQSLLSKARDSLDAAWAVIGIFPDGTSTSSESEPTITDADVDQIRIDVQSDISAVGQVLDSMLDLLEGFEDSLPDYWIEELDLLEEEYSEWTMAVHNIMLQWDSEDEQVPMAAYHDQEKETSPLPASFDSGLHNFYISASDFSGSNSIVQKDTNIEETTFLEQKTPSDQIVEFPVESLGDQSANDSVSSSPALTSKHNSILVDNEEKNIQDLDQRGLDDHRESSFLYDSDDSAHISGNGTGNVGLDPSGLIEQEQDPTVDPPQDPLITTIPLEMKSSEELANDTHVKAPNATKIAREESLSTDDQMDRQINSILTNLPTRIKFKRNRSERLSQPRAQTPELPRSSSRPASPFLTLVPAETREPRAAKFSGDSPIRLYYLSQAGRQQPIKLFVRLVGERGERVMVRVGGGWADLAQYLREYATHHSRTMIPSPNEELQAVDVRNPANSRVFSLPSTFFDSNSSSSPTPNSSFQEDLARLSYERQISQTPSDSLHTLKRRPGMRSINRSTSFEGPLPPATAPESEDPRTLQVGQPTSYLSESSSSLTDEVASPTVHTESLNTGANPAQSLAPSSLNSGRFELLNKTGNTKRIFRVSDGVWGS